MLHLGASNARRQPHLLLSHASIHLCHLWCPHFSGPLLSYQGCISLHYSIVLKPSMYRFNFPWTDWTAKCHWLYPRSCSVPCFLSLLASLLSVGSFLDPASYLQQIYLTEHNRACAVRVTLERSGPAVMDPLMANAHRSQHTLLPSYFSSPLGLLHFSSSSQFFLSSAVTHWKHDFFTR